MKSLRLSLLAATALANPVLQGRGEDGLPSGCVYVNNIAFGAVPDDGSGGGTPLSMQTLNSELGATICAFGRYSQVASSDYDASQLTSVLSEAQSDGNAVFQASVMPTLNPLSSFNSGTASQVASALKQFTDSGLEVWLRFGHEMNWYFQPGSGQNGGSEYHGSAEDFINAWILMYKAVASNSAIKMWWSPNQDGNNDYDQYWPGEQYVDMVGVDCYPDQSSSLKSNQFDSCYQSFYQAYSETYNLPFAIGETGYYGPDGNDAWLSDLMNPPSGYPNYISMSWFEFQKGSDFKVIDNPNYIAETKKILLQGGTDSGGGGGGGGGFPADTCSWGCEGWDCSSSSPCQSAYTCSGGYCSDCSWGCNGWSCSASQPCNADYSCVSGYCHHSGPATK